MKLSDAREAYYEYSKNLSAIVRQLGFAAIAIIWVFRTNDVGSSGRLPREFLWPGVWVVVALAFDLLHYTVGSFVWGRFARAKEKGGVSRDQEFKAPDWVNWPTISFFVAKIVSIIIAYVLLGTVLLNRLF